MAPHPSALYTTSLLLSLLATLLLAGTLRLLAILPRGRPSTPSTPSTSPPIALSRSRPNLQTRKPGTPTRLLIVLGSGGHTHEMFYLLRDLDTRKYTHRTYVVSSGDAFSAGRAREFERVLEGRAREGIREIEVQREMEGKSGTPSIKVTGVEGMENGGTRNGTVRRGRRRTRSGSGSSAKPQAQVGAESSEETSVQHDQDESQNVGPDNYSIVTLPRARSIHQPLLTTPFTCLLTLLSAFEPLLSSPSESTKSTPPPRDYAPSPSDPCNRPPDLIITNGPATAVIIVLASLVLKFFNTRGSSSKGLCKTIYVESFARVTTLSLSGKILVHLVDRFLVQWEELEAKTKGRCEFWGVLV